MRVLTCQSLVINLVNGLACSMRLLVVSRQVGAARFHIGAFGMFFGVSPLALMAGLSFVVPARNQC